MKDQATELRKLVINHHNVNAQIKSNNCIKIYSIVSGKGGVGKTNISINLAIKLQQMGKNVLILDADMGMANVDIMMGVEPKYDLFDFIRGNVTLKEIITSGPAGVDFISGGSGLFSIEALDYTKQQVFMEQLGELSVYDVLIIDNGAGITKESLTFITFSHEVVLVTTPEPTAITDGYRVLKAISTYKLKDKVKMIINQIDREIDGELTFEKLRKTSEQFLYLKLEKIGFIYNDIRVNKAIMEQIPIVLKYPNALAAKNMTQISNYLLGDKEYHKNTSSIKQLSNRFIKVFG
ncbi:MAG: MinD/ParA family protein [Eubacteriales bacterium]